MIKYVVRAIQPPNPRGHLYWIGSNHWHMQIEHRLQFNSREEARTAYTGTDLIRIVAVRVTVEEV